MFLFSSRVKCFKFFLIVIHCFAFAYKFSFVKKVLGLAVMSEVCCTIPNCLSTGLELDFQWERTRAVSGRPETVTVRFTAPIAIFAYGKVKG